MNVIARLGFELAYYARNWNLTILPNCIYANRNPFLRMRRIIFSGIWWYKRISKSWPEEVLIREKENWSPSEFCRFNEPRSENKWKWKERQVLGPFQGTTKAERHEDDIYHLYLACLRRSLQTWKYYWENRKSVDESRPSRLQQWRRIQETKGDLVSPKF